MTIVPSEHVDVVVLGGGLAGCAAMLAAAEAGRSVTLLEKRDTVGGSTVLSAGLSAFAGTDEQEAAGIEDSADLLRSDIIETGLRLCDERLVDLYCDHQLATYRWLKGHGIKYGTVHAASGQTVPRSHPTDTTLLLDTLVGKASELGGRLVTGVA
ncbi:MAG: FAD-dependent oxidoreductase, partial [Pseudonocardia sp.]|nr:FAD-dependent oxidoreductase [Pseudonocardia sp.]